MLQQNSGATQQNAEATNYFWCKLNNIENQGLRYNGMYCFAVESLFYPKVGGKLGAESPTTVICRNAQNISGKIVIHA